MFDRFSDHAKKVMSHARREANELRHGYLAPEHLLLGILDLPGSRAVEILGQLRVAPDALRSVVMTMTHAGTHTGTQTQLPFTPPATSVLEATLEESVRLGHAHIGSEHVLLGLTRVPNTAAQQALAQLGIGVEAVRSAVASTFATKQRTNVRLLLISNSTMHGGAYLAHCAAEIRDFLGARKKVLFVPYALHDHDAYAKKAEQAFAALGHDLVSVHTRGHSPAAVAEADAVFVGGGNTFRLLNALYHYALLPAIQQRALAGMPYIGSSAGTNIATLSIRTTNDMPIVQPPSFTALQLVPFQINPHFLDHDPASRHMGETREERLRQFHEEHETPVLGLREGCLLRVDGERATLRGSTAARLFQRGQEPREFTPPCDLSFLLQNAPA